MSGRPTAVRDGIVRVGIALILVTSTLAGCAASTVTDGLGTVLDAEPLQEDRPVEYRSAQTTSPLGPFDRWRATAGLN